MDGSDLLFRYHNKELNFHGCYGMFKKNYLKSIGGMRQSGVGLSPYSSEIIILHSAHEDKIGYQDKSPIFYRYHNDSLSIYSQDVESYVTSQFVFLDELKSALIMDSHLH